MTRTIREDSSAPFFQALHFRSSIISPEQPSEAVAPVAPTTSDEPDGTGPEPRKTQAIGQHATSAPVALDEVAARGLSGVELQETSEPQLQQLEGEKWVLPATIKVKD